MAGLVEARGQNGKLKTVAPICRHAAFHTRGSGSIPVLRGRCGPPAALFDAECPGLAEIAFRAFSGRRVAWQGCLERQVR